MRTDKQPKLAEMAQEVPAREAWRVFGIMAEFVEATERLVGIHPAVSVFGSARVKPGTPYWKLAEETARLLSDAGFSVVSGGGPGLMEATTRARSRATAWPSASTSTCPASSRVTATRTSACASAISLPAR